MTAVPASFPDDGALFEGDRDERYLGVALETLVQDVSPTGDQETAKRLGGYMLGDESPPADAPEYVELTDGSVQLSNPPFLEARVDIAEREEYALSIEFDSELDLLIDPPVTVELAGRFEELVETLEQMLAEIYRTKGRRLEMIDSGVVDPEEFAERR